jgi:hypothetical protein
LTTSKSSISVRPATKIRKKYNVEVLIILPYGPDVAKAWVDVLPEQLDKVKGRKYPADPAKLDEKGKQSMEHYRGPAGIRLSVQGPRCRERNEVRLGAARGAFQSVDVRAARFSPEGKAYRLLAGARGFFAPTWSSAAAYCGD